MQAIKFEDLTIAQFTELMLNSCEAIEIALEGISSYDLDEIPSLEFCILEHDNIISIFDYANLDHWDVASFFCVPDEVAEQFLDNESLHSFTLERFVGLYNRATAPIDLINDKLPTISEIF